MSPLPIPSLAPLLRLFQRQRELLALSLAIASGCLPAGAAAIPYSQARIFQSNSTGRQIETRMGTSAALGNTLAVLGAPFDNIGGEDNGVVWVHDATSGALLQRLENPAPFKDSYFGWSVAVSGSLVVVGVPNDNAAENDAGVVYVYNLASSTPSVPAFVLSNPSPAENDSFGWSVAIFGNRVVVGAPKAGAGSSDAGRVYTYDLSTGSPTTPVVQIENPNATINFGHAVAIDGTKVVASALQESTTGDTCRVHVFDLSLGTPSQPLLSLADATPSTNDSFGHAVAISGTKVAVTSPLFDNGFANTGAAYIYDLVSDTPVVPVHTLANPTSALNDNFGSSVTIAGARVVVGVALDDQGGEDAGVACVYDLNSGTTTPVLTLQPAGTSSGDELGQAVSLFGSRLLVTAPDDNTGISADVGTAYVVDLGTGTPSAVLLTFNNPSPSSHEEFGFSVALNGNLAVVGCQKDDKVASNAGSVSLFDLGATFPEQPWLVIDNPSPTTNDYFGTAVASAGTKVVVSAYQDDTAGTNTGTVYVFDTTSPSPGALIRTLVNPLPNSQDQFGNAVAISGNLIVVGCARNEVAGFVHAGSVFIYDLTSGSPTMPILTLDNPAPAAEDAFGYSVAISGTKVVVGANQNDAGVVDAGSVYVYDVSAGSASSTMPVRTWDNPSPALEDEFGYSVAISGDRIVVGCPADDAGATDAGAAYLYDLTATNPGSPVATLLHPDSENEEFFGSAVAISGTRIAVGAPEDDISATDGGCLYVYEVTSATFPTPADRLVSENQPANEHLGFSVAVDGANVLAGAPLHDANTSGRGAVYLFDPDPPAPQMQVEQPPGTGLIAGEASIQFGNVPANSQGHTETVTIRNVGTSPLDITEIAIEGGNLDDFSVETVALPWTLQVDQILQFDVSFSASNTGTRVTTLRIESNAAVDTFTVTLTGQALSSADDTDGDGINDVAELGMVALGFDWQVNDEELLLILQAGANTVGLYGETQVEAMNQGTPVITVHGGTGRYTITLPVEKSVDLMDFDLFPVQAPAVSISGQGGLDLDITPSGSKGFFRFSPR
ncbi:choice-of-anchor D domain-containing protein [Luteolibacter arcticus]|uniref:Choice-of-anchor D domain-containing protein n=1 Tax=Luteolibacter arcticus TaxID=1581411 RepID=A0ABT3GGY7_9BACT|nr:choice-of-anchor D domain-containing protein [Luteolibacter arcticus]MCW1922885.1 choice-of-anchor D domain-containing protein [Luteolibacter arcticus]